MQTHSKQIFPFIAQGQLIKFTGDFDSGNLQSVTQLSAYVYHIVPKYDKISKTSKKTFFHFRVSGFKNCTVTFIIGRAYILQQFLKYSPTKQPQLRFDYIFTQQKGVQLAFSYPYSYHQCQKLISHLNNKYYQHPQIYFHQQTLFITKTQKQVSLLTITQKTNCQEDRQQPLEFMQGQRPFKINKPRVVVSARVHPGESPSSYCMEGVLLFLLDEVDYRSEVLRKNFCFVIVPMINVEGVSQGLFRLNPLGHNLNRVYHTQQPMHQPIFTLSKYIKSLPSIDFFFDLHSHPSLKSFFIYGNALKTPQQQTQAQLFGKLIQTNCPYFQNLQSIFSQKAMNSKDKYDQHSKQGCGRVYYNRVHGMIHSYTVQCGYFKPKRIGVYNQVKKNIKFMDRYTSQWQDISMEQYSPKQYKLLGKMLLVTLLDLFHLNPFSRFSSCNRINTLRQSMYGRVLGEVDRFKDKNVVKRSQITSHIQNKYYRDRFGRYDLSVVPKEVLAPLLIKGEMQPPKLIKIKTTQDTSNITTSLKTRKSIPLRDHCPSSTILLTMQNTQPPNKNTQRPIYHNQLLQSFSKYQRPPSMPKKKAQSLGRKKMKTQQAPITHTTPSSLTVNFKLPSKKKNSLVQTQGPLQIRLNSYELQAVQRWLESKLRHQAMKKLRPKKIQHIPVLEKQMLPKPTKRAILDIHKIPISSKQQIKIPKLTLSTHK